MSTPTTLFDKVWRAHEVHRSESGQSLLWIDRHLSTKAPFMRSISWLNANCPLLGPI